MPNSVPRPSTVVRDFMLWLFDTSYGEPYISASVDITWDNAQRWLDRVNVDADVRVTTHHLFTAAVGRLYAEFPVINARVFGRQIYGLDSVDIVMPVNLLGQEVGRELSMILLKGVDRLDPQGVARATRPQVDAERSGAGSNPIVAGLLDAGSRSPTALRVALRSLATLSHSPRGARLLARQFPVSTLITNVGAALGTAEGIRFRAVAFSPPERLIHMGSLFGLGPLDRIPIVDGDDIRPALVLPVAFIFDHRLIDGVMAGRLLARLAALLQDPEATWPTSPAATGA